MAPLDFASLSEMGRAHEKPSSLSHRIALRYRKDRLRRNAFREDNQQFSPELVDARKQHAYLLGYWHDERYFKDAKKVIASDFAMRGEYASELAKPISDCESVCLNVRRTDFVELSAERDYRTECGEEYYRKAIDLVIEQHKDIRIFGFSDDVEWCEENLKLQRGAVETGNADELHALDYEFHKLICDAANCSLAFKTIAEIKTHTDRVCMLELSDAAGRLEVLEGHTDIFNALSVGDEETAVAMMRLHLRHLDGTLATACENYPDFFEE